MAAAAQTLQGLEGGQQQVQPATTRLDRLRNEFDRLVSSLPPALRSDNPELLVDYLSGVFKPGDADSAFGLSASKASPPATSHGTNGCAAAPRPVVWHELARALSGIGASCSGSNAKSSAPNGILANGCAGPLAIAAACGNGPATVAAAAANGAAGGGPANGVAGGGAANGVASTHLGHAPNQQQQQQEPHKLQLRLEAAAARVEREVASIDASVWAPIADLGSLAVSGYSSVADLVRCCTCSRVLLSRAFEAHRKFCRNRSRQPTPTPSMMTSGGSMQTDPQGRANASDLTAKPPAKRKRVSSGGAGGKAGGAAAAAGGLAGQPKLSRLSNLQSASPTHAGSAARLEEDMPLSLRVAAGTAAAAGAAAVAATSPTAAWANGGGGGGRTWCWELDEADPSEPSFPHGARRRRSRKPRRRRKFWSQPASPSCSRGAAGHSHGGGMGPGGDAAAAGARCTSTTAGAGAQAAAGSTGLSCAAAVALPPAPSPAAAVGQPPRGPGFAPAGSSGRLNSAAAAVAAMDLGLPLDLGGALQGVGPGSGLGGFGDDDVHGLGGLDDLLALPFDDEDDPLMSADLGLGSLSPPPGLGLPPGTGDTHPSPKVPLGPTMVPRASRTSRGAMTCTGLGPYKCSSSSWDWE